MSYQKGRAASLARPITPTGVLDAGELRHEEVVFHGIDHCPDLTNKLPEGGECRAAAGVMRLPAAKQPPTGRFFAA